MTQQKLVYLGFYIFAIISAPHVDNEKFSPLFYEIIT